MSGPRIKLPTVVAATPDVSLRISLYNEPSAAGGIRAHVITGSPTNRGHEVWLDAPALRELVDFLSAELPR